MRMITRTFLTGLVTALPVAASLYLLVWLVVSAESVLGSTMQSALPDLVYLPGMGLALVVIVIFLIGLLMRTWLVQRLFAWAEAVLYRTPVVKSVYGTLRDLFVFMTESRHAELQQVVSVRFGNANMKLIGFVTRSDLAGLPQGINGMEDIMVYLPLSYQIGGYMVIVPRGQVEPLDMSFEDAMRLALTAGLSVKANNRKP